MRLIVEVGEKGVSLSTPPNADPLSILGLLEVAKAIVLDRMKTPASPILVPADAQALGRQVHA